MRSVGQRAPVATSAAGDPWFREATAADLAAVRDIYAWHVERGTGTFEEVPPSVEDMTGRWRGIVEAGLPYLVAVVEGRVGGFAYVAPFRPRSAYRHTVEDSIYLDPVLVGQGLGRRLLGGLIERCTERGFRQMVAVIGDSANAASIRLHAGHGFQRAGMLTATGFKFGRWLDAVFMQRPLGEGGRSLPPR
ncbi:MAG: GNAT family N-acetyltransferase [Rhodospirillales bacterium]